MARLGINSTIIHHADFKIAVAEFKIGPDGEKLLYCRRCKEFKEIDAFLFRTGRNAHGAMIKRPYCAICMIEYGTRYRRKVLGKPPFKYRRYRVQNGLLYLWCTKHKRFVLSIGFHRRPGRGDNTDPLNLPSYKSYCKECGRKMVRAYQEKKRTAMLSGKANSGETFEY